MSQQEEIQPRESTTTVPVAPPETSGGDGGQDSVSSRRHRTSLFDRKILRRAIIDSFIKLNPRVQARNPVMFVVEIGSVITTIELVHALLDPSLSGDVVFTLGVAVWLWFTVLFANFAEAMAEGRGKAQAETLRRARTETQAKLPMRAPKDAKSPSR